MVGGPLLYMSPSVSPHKIYGFHYALHMRQVLILPVLASAPTIPMPDGSIGVPMDGVTHTQPDGQTKTSRGTSGLM